MTLGNCFSQHGIFCPVIYGRDVPSDWSSKEGDVALKLGSRGDGQDDTCVLGRGLFYKQSRYICNAGMKLMFRISLIFSPSPNFNAGL